MKKNVWKYGFLSGLALAVPMGFSVPLEHRIGASWRSSSMWRAG